MLRAVAHFSAVLVTGPRRSGKTTLLRHLFPDARHVLLEDPDVVARVRADPNTPGVQAVGWRAVHAWLDEEPAARKRE